MYLPPKSGWAVKKLTLTLAKALSFKLFTSISKDTAVVVLKLKFAGTCKSLMPPLTVVGSMVSTCSLILELHDYKAKTAINE